MRLHRLCVDNNVANAASDHVASGRITVVCSRPIDASICRHPSSTPQPDRPTDRSLRARPAVGRRAPETALNCVERRQGFSAGPTGRTRTRTSTRIVHGCRRAKPPRTGSQAANTNGRVSLSATTQPCPARH